MRFQKVTEKHEKLGTSENKRKKRILIKDNDDGSVLEGILQKREKHLISLYLLYFGKEADNVYIPEDDDSVDGDDER